MNSKRFFMMALFVGLFSFGTAQAQGPGGRPPGGPGGPGGPEQFARFHPAGNLGRQLQTVGEVMRQKEQLRIACQSQTVREVFLSMRKPGRRTGAVMLVDEEGCLAGLFTDSDLARLFECRQDERLDQPICEVMTHKPRTIHAQALLGQAVEILCGKDMAVRASHMALSMVEALAGKGRGKDSVTLAMTVVLIAVYVPVGFQGGLTGALFTEFAFTLAASVTVSAVVALTLSPMNCAKMLRRLIGEDIELIVASDGGSLMVMADKAQLEQVVRDVPGQVQRVGHVADGTLQRCGHHAVTLGRGAHQRPVDALVEGMDLAVGGFERVVDAIGSRARAAGGQKRHRCNERRNSQPAS